MHTNENLVFFKEKKKVQIQIKSKIIYLNADFWFAGLHYFDLNKMHPFLSEMICHYITPVFLQYRFLELDRLDGLG